MKHNNQHRIKWITLFFLIITGVLLFAAIFIFLVSGSDEKVDNYNQCIKAKDAKILEIYPEQCVFNGKTFTNPTP